LPPPARAQPKKGKKAAAAAAAAGDGKAAKKPRKKKDPNAPKKAMSAFMYFSNDSRERVKAANPGIAFGQVQGHGGGGLGASRLRGPGAGASILCCSHPARTAPGAAAPPA
jgi:hypothetical protein